MIDKRLYNFSGNIKKYISITTFLSCIKLIANIFFYFIFAFLLVSLINKDFSFSYGYIIISILIIVFIRQFSTIKISHMLGNLVVDVKRNLRKIIFEKTLKLGLAYSQLFKTQELIHLSIDNVEQLEVYFGGFLTQFYYCIVSSFILFFSIAYFNLKIASILLGFSLAIPLSLYIILNKVKKIQKKYFAKYMNVGTLFLDSLQGLTTLKIYGTDEIREEEIAKMSEEFRIETMRVLKMQLLSIAVINWIIYAGTILAIVTSVKLFLNGSLGLFPMLFIFMLAPEFFIPMRTLTSLFHVAMTGVSAAENIISFVDSPERNNNGNKEFKNENEIKVSKLNFSYPDGTQSLKDIDISFKKGNLTAVVGHSGCGKSTLVSVLSGELKSKENEIFVDDIDIQNIKIEDKIKNILKITHDSHIFSGTVRENLTMANENLSDETMIEVLKKVKLWDIFSKNKGLDTSLESQGKNLSGGQAQRVALARALLYDASVYIFDEATSNIDIESEEIILNIIYSLSKEKTVIYISHRLPAIKNADCIYVMDKGKVIESGKHIKLYAKKGLYYEMYKHQEELETYLTKRGENNEKSVNF
ncbi:ABC transporter, permease/ATP-binding protein [Fusobacterium animalis 11_3_2]|uniref:ABC transporter, permease/ATP-binding protein n=1 Tax=Fusobacterium animalis 11_3_2 TaxID=457403 RepID=F7L2G8_9FUSO|nr:ABC transporter ATP-binding protein/permease [Fusobacterium animalis]EGN65698.1 ABC transporter, permease/ATP-binding protein [Fusobacterium animalis 11_3_2]